MSLVVISVVSRVTKPLFQVVPSHSKQADMEVVVYLWSHRRTSSMTIQPISLYEQPHADLRRTWLHSIVWSASGARAAGFTWKRAGLRASKPLVLAVASTIQYNRMSSILAVLSWW